MGSQRVFLTGASGCIGQYIAEALMTQTDCELYLLVRDPSRLTIDPKTRAGVHVLVGDLQEIAKYGELLQTIDCAILTAAAWGGGTSPHDINVSKTVQLVQLLNPAVCDRIIYFSTASLLDQTGQVLREAAHFGTDYIRSKYDALKQLQRLDLADRLTILFPTLVWGGDQHKRQSHLTAGLCDVLKWAWLLRFIKLEGSFHNIHAQDIAQVVTYLVQQPHLEPRQWVLGGKAYQVNEAIAELCQYMGQPVSWRINLSPWLLELLIKVFKIQLASWDRFCLDHRHFTYPQPIDPAALNMMPYCQTLSDILSVSGIASPSARPPISG